MKRTTEDMSDGYIRTYTGRRFYPLDPSVSDVSIVDIAHALALNARFTGHTKVHCSVAQHCVLVSYLSKPENALWGLLHDASEAYLCDIASPVKRHPLFAFYREAEKRLQAVICKAFGLDADEPLDVKEADWMALKIEAKELMPRCFLIDDVTDKDFGSWGMPKYRAWSHEEAEHKFLQRFAELKGF